MTNALGSVVAGRVERSATTAWLALGDALVIAAFLTLGALQHNINPITHPLYVADTVAPFLIGWVIAAPLVGVYAPRARQSVPTGVVLVVGAWIPAALIGLTLRASPYFHGNAPLSFAAVALGTGAVSLAIWRAVMTYFLGK